MTEDVFDKTKVSRYLVLTFALAYVIQFIAGWIWNHVSILAGQFITAAVMFVPTIGVLLAGEKLSGMGWKPRIQKNWKNILLAWLLPGILTILGAALYFLIFPRHFDLSGGYVVQAGGQEALEQMEAQGLSYPVAILATAAAALTYGPLVNTFVALGEETGWRGFLYPQLKAGFGKRKAWILGGIIWGAWHWPLIWLIGYEYGAAAGNPAGYIGFPVTGMLAMLIFTVTAGILADWLYERSGSIWLPSLFHGAVNAVFSIPFTVCMINTGSARLLGPAINGLIGGLPMLIFAALLFFREEKE